jgi:hypothetical protein
LKRGWLSNALLLAASVATGLGLCELAFVPLLPHVPLKLQGALHPGLRLFAQSSKSGLEPEDYVALLGDSYAQGFGDWLLGADPERNGEFHSAHLLHDWSGRDVVSFGGSGAGSLRGLVAEPIARSEWVNAGRRLHLDPPRDALIYFYEGNDLDDNLKDLRMRYAPDHDPARLYDPGYFRAFVDQVVIGRNPLHREALAHRPWDDLFFLRGLPRLVSFAFRRWRGDHPGRRSWPPGQVNRARVGDREVALPDGLQAPALELDAAEIDRALWVFERALARLRDAWPDTRLCVLYVPSPLASYELTSERVSIQSYEGRGSEYPAALVHRRSDAIARRVAEIARAQGAGFVDARPLVRWASARALVHGPRDWEHFNRRGYEALARADLEALGAAASPPRDR